MEKEFGVNVFGYINGEFGLGEAVRLIIKAILSNGIPVALINYDVTTNHRHEDKTYIDFSAEAPYSINLILLGPSEAKKILTHYSNAEFFRGKYNIFYLNWESEYFPQEYSDNLSFYDEIWVPAKYCQHVISKVSNVPVSVVHYPIEIKFLDVIDTEANDFYDKSRFNFLFIFDYNSTMERKNTLNLIEAFKKAFKKDDKSVRLTIKTSRSNRFSKEKAKLVASIGDYENISIVEKIFEKETLHTIIKLCDCYISLHRSEGFGLTLAEAMFFGKPVIATGYSGNLEFMNSENSYLVNYEVCKADTGIINYDINTVWSNPDVNHAVELLRLVRENSNEVKEVAKKGNETIVNEFSTKKVGNEIKMKLDTIFKNFIHNPLKDELIGLYIENEKMKSKLIIVNKSKIITFILDIKQFFRNRKSKRRQKRKKTI